MVLWMNSKTYVSVTVRVISAATGFGERVVRRHIVEGVVDPSDLVSLSRYVASGVLVNRAPESSSSLPSEPSSEPLPSATPPPPSVPPDAVERGASSDEFSDAPQGGENNAAMDAFLSGVGGLRKIEGEVGIDEDAEFLGKVKRYRSLLPAMPEGWDDLSVDEQGELRGLELEVGEYCKRRSGR